MSRLDELVNEAILCQVDESHHLEFKQVLFPKNLDQFKNDQGKYEIKYDQKKPPYLFSSPKQVQKYFEFQCMREIAAFLNSKGGDLIIGISDKPENETGKRLVTSVVGEMFIDKDSFEQNLYDIFNEYFGKQITTDNLGVEFVSYEENVLCVVTAEQTDQNVIISTTYSSDKQLNEEAIFVRQGNRTQKIENNPAEILSFANRNKKKEPARAIKKEKVLTNINTSVINEKKIAENESDIAEDLNAINKPTQQRERWKSNASVLLDVIKENNKVILIMDDGTRRVKTDGELDITCDVTRKLIGCKIFTEPPDSEIGKPYEFFCNVYLIE